MAEKLYLSQCKTEEKAIRNFQSIITAIGMESRLGPIRKKSGYFMKQEIRVIKIKVRTLESITPLKHPVISSTKVVLKH